MAAFLLPQKILIFFKRLSTAIRAKNQQLKKTFYSNGKLLITGEYVVLDGALALALPTKFGQNLEVEPDFNNQIIWKSYDADGSVWFSEIILFSDIIYKTTLEHNAVKSTLIEILHEGYLLNPKFINDSSGYLVTTKLTFPKFWGLGTSSTLINNVASWLEVDAFVLLKNAFGGSGYDIACAQNNEPILYQLNNGKPIVKPIGFDPIFKDNLYFVYLNKKQNSKTAISNYHKKQNNNDTYIAEINQRTEKIIVSKTLDAFQELLTEHEQLLSSILEIKTVQEELFPDFNGTIKSLGAWGGDFVLAVSKSNPKEYFNKKGYNIVLDYSKMIL